MSYVIRNGKPHVYDPIIGDLVEVPPSAAFTPDETEPIEDAARRMAEYLADIEGLDIDNVGDGESILVFYGASGGGSISINLHELARVARDLEPTTGD